MFVSALTLILIVSAASKRVPNENETALSNSLLKTVEAMMDSLFAVEEHISGRFQLSWKGNYFNVVIYGIMDNTIRKTTGDLETIYTKEFR